MKQVIQWVSLLAISLYCSNGNARSTPKKTCGIYGRIETINRTITESYGEIERVPFSSIIVSSQTNAKFIKKAQANRYGKFTITLPPGKYTVKASVPATSVSQGWQPESTETAVTVWRGFYTGSNLLIDIN